MQKLANCFASPEFTQFEPFPAKEENNQTLGK